MRSTLFSMSLLAGILADGQSNMAVTNNTTVRIASGTNVDDLGDYRPGLEAARQHNVVHPYVEAGLHKAGQKVSCIGFGGGLTWGGMLVTYSPLSHG